MGEGKQLLIVDDDPQVVWGVGKHLTRSGFRVTTCGDGQEAIEVMKSEAFDTVITDVQMPRLNGLALLDWIAQNRPDTNIIIMTAFGSPLIRQVAVKKGAVLYLEKPVDPLLLVEVLSTPVEEGFSGVVDRVDLFDYVQMVLSSASSAVLEVSSGTGERGLIYVQLGNIVHAECGPVEGEEAFFRCMGYRCGSFKTLPWQEPTKRTIERPGGFVLMEAARRKDESALSPVPGRPVEAHQQERGVANPVIAERSDWFREGTLPDFELGELGTVKEESMAPEAGRETEIHHGN